MKTTTVFICFVFALVIVALLWLGDEFLAPRFLDSRIERLGESGLPKITIENGDTVYCRMKADDFRFPLPPGTHATNLIVSGVFDSVDGSVEARYETTNHMTAVQYDIWLLGKVPVGGRVTSAITSNGLFIEFHYFGDRWV